MATFKAEVSPHIRKDGTRLVKIRVTHRGTPRWVATPMYAEPRQLTRSLKIKDHSLIEKCDKIIHEWRSIVVDLGSYADTLSVDELIEALKAGSSARQGFRLDIVAYLRKLAKGRKPNTAHNYNVLAASLTQYADGRVLDIADITPAMLSDYERWMRNKLMSANTIYLYMATLKAAHNRARLEYNDEDSGIIRVTRRPFEKYHIPQLPAPSARGVTLEVLQAIADLEDDTRINSLRNFGRDILMLSFALGGMNYADLYNAPYSAWCGDYIEYHRQKTTDARADKALFRVRIEPEVRRLVEKYLDPKRKTLFLFRHRYTSSTAFASVVSRAVGVVEAAVPAQRHYTYYSIRHTYATLARNVLDIDKYTVHELLNHTDKSMRITDRYIERDWQPLYDAHRKIILLVDWSKICCG